MKKYLITFMSLTFTFLLFSNSAFAQTPTTSAINQEIQQKLLKQIASKAAQLKLTEKRGMIGIVDEVKDTSLTLTDLSGNTRFVDVDELTKFFSATNKSIGISDIEKGDTIGVLGLYNKDSRRLLAREINILKTPKVVVGAVSEIDKKNFQLVVGTEKESIKVDVANITKTYAYEKEDLETSGFSKIATDETIIVIGYPDSTDEKMIVASRIIIFPSIPKNPRIISAPKIETDESVVPSTGSGKKLTPIVETEEE
jgi:hypothetical protein